MGRHALLYRFPEKRLVMNGMPALLLSIFLLVVFFCGYFIQQITGFGAAIFCLPFALLVLPREVFMPAAWLFTGGQAILILIRQRKKVNVRQMMIVLTLAVLFGPISADYLLAHVSEALIKICLGLFIIVNSAYELYGIYRGKKKKGLRLWHCLYPIGSGALQSAYGIGGPLLIAYLNKTVEEKDALRSTVCGYWAVLNTFLLGKYIVSGQMTSVSAGVCLMLLPAVLAGAVTGSIVLKKINQRTFTIAVHCVLMGSAIFMII